MGEIPWYDLLFNLSFSFFGGLIKSVTSRKQNKKWSFFFASAIIGGFAGLLTYMLCSSCHLSWQMTSFATGVAGYMGDSILKIFSDFLPKILTKHFDIKITEIKEDKK